jgi:hypothetical protein
VTEMDWPTVVYLLGFMAFVAFIMWLVTRR